ncbi:MAG: carbamoyltransferase [Rhodothermaceae bacterium]|nr:carbamoyltransferase [Rhodothermaceae bacterium]
MTVLGISAFYHDSAAAIVSDGEIIAAAQEERFTRKKHDPGFPVNAVRFCLDHAGVSLDELDAIAFYDKPLLKFERLLDTYYGFAPRGLRSFMAAIPVWLREKMFIKRTILEELYKIDAFDPKKVKLLFPEHHLSHAASAFYPSPYDEAAILTIDGVGEWATASVCMGRDTSIEVISELHFPHSIGLLYSAFTLYTGFRVNSGEYKLMGLAPYGDPESERTKMFVDAIYKELIDLKEDGSIWLNQDYFDYATGLRMTRDNKWEQLFGLPARRPESELTQPYCDMALAVQQVTEEAVRRMARETQRVTGARNLCMAGGVALNCVANGKILGDGIFNEIFIQPAAGDAGGAVGAALAASHIYFGESRPDLNGRMDRMNGAALGPEFSGLDIEQAARRNKAVYTKFDDMDELTAITAELLDEGNAVGWFQGRMEFGPRALGNRSILGDARNPEMQKKLNVKIKYRESFRPFAPSVLAEDAPDYFDLDTGSPYMLLVRDVAADRRKPLPPGYHQLPIREKLYHLRSDIPAVTHIDYSARIQTVHRQSNERYWKLIAAFKKRTGCSLLVNTSFNVRGEPIVCTPDQAYTCLMRTEMDALVMGNYLFLKSQQPEYKHAGEWQQEFPLD